MKDQKGLKPDHPDDPELSVNLIPEDLLQFITLHLLQYLFTVYTEDNSCSACGGSWKFEAPNISVCQESMNFSYACDSQPNNDVFLKTPDVSEQYKAPKSYLVSKLPITSN